MWLADMKSIAKEVVEQERSMCALVHEWYICSFIAWRELAFVCSDSTSLPKQIMPILSSHHSIAENRLNLKFPCLYC